MTDVNEAAAALRDALIAEGGDPALIDAHLSSIMPRVASVVPNLADVQRAAAEAEEEPSAPAVAAPLEEAPVETLSSPEEEVPSG